MAAFEPVKRIRKNALMSGRPAALLVLAVLGALCGSWVGWRHQTADEAVGVQFVCLTNIPGDGPRALFNVTNRTVDLIGVPGYGHVGPGESVTLPLLVPPGTSPWRVSVQWQCLEPGWFGYTMNGLRRRVEDALGAPRHVDAWFPPMRVSTSPEIQR